MIWPLFLQLIISYSSFFHLWCNHAELLTVFWIPHALSFSRKKENYVLPFLLKHFLSCSSHRNLFLLILNVWVYMLGLQKGHSWSFSPSLLSFIVLIKFILKHYFSLFAFFCLSHWNVSSIRLGNTYILCTVAWLLPSRRPNTGLNKYLLSKEIKIQMV